MTDRRPLNGVFAATTSSRPEAGGGFRATTESSQRGQGGSVGATTQRSQYCGPTLQERLVSGGGACFVVVALGGVLMSLSSAEIRQKIKQESLKVFSLDAPAPPPEVPTPPKPQPQVAVVETPHFEPVPTPLIIVPTAVTTANPVPIAAPEPPAPVQITAPAVSTPAISSVPTEVQNPACSIPKPTYPIRAKRLQQTGLAVVAITIAADGQIISQTVRKSSGHPELDSRALETVRGKRCRSGTGLMAAKLSINFDLDQR